MNNQSFIDQVGENLPLVAVVVPTFNRKRTTLRFLAQMSQQSYPSLSVIIADANSKDGTASDIQHQFPEAKVLSVSNHDFWAGATNAGIRHAFQIGCDYILTINDDAVVGPNYIKRLVQIAQRHRCSILGNQINYLSDPNRIWSLGTYTSWGTQNFLRLAYCDQNQADLPTKVGTADVIEVDALPGNGVLIHRSVFEHIGFYNEVLLPHYHADSELIMRARRQGIPAYVTPKVVLYNDFSITQKQLCLKTPRGIFYALFHKKSHLYLPPLLYILSRYCPFKKWLHTLSAVGSRFLAMGSS